jgi:hypothetical protein
LQGESYDNVATTKRKANKGEKKRISGKRKKSVTARDKYPEAVTNYE